jgi:hypothetical protein
MAFLSERTGLVPVDTTIALANNATTTIQNMSAYNHQELVGHVEIVASSTYRAAVRVTVIKNGAGTYEVASSDLAGDDNSGNPIVSFSMSGSNLQATLVSYGGFTSASIRYHLQHAVTNANYPLSIDASQILSGTVDAARLPIPVIAAATNTSTTSISSTTETTVNWSTATIDTASGWDLANNKYVVPSDGYYQISWEGTVASGNSVNWLASALSFLKVDGTVVSTSSGFITQGSAQNFLRTAYMTGSTTIQLDATDEITVTAQCTTFSSATWNINAFKISIVKIGRDA